MLTETAMIRRERNIQAFDCLSTLIRQYKSSFFEKGVLEEKLSLTTKPTMIKLIRDELTSYSKYLKFLDVQKSYYYDYLQKNR